ncbi:MAG TPA: hypothetical protein PKN04_10320 [bacterium]|nr:hypothetical protein [bacterium]HNT66161.1 hypothetical protein [bacterium]HOX87090.1 hypothetical protein [bacterium]HPG46421.1 hypothetical protein [bacterium]HPM98666.1 hypothetical protein [bacterium]
MWWKTILWVFFGLAVLIAGLLLYGSFRWQSRTKKMHADLDGARRTVAPSIYSPNELVDLPAPVQRYFMAVLNEGQPMVTAVAVEHTGTFNLSETGENWTPFTSVQRVVMQRPGFDWEARMSMMPGLTVRVHDAYIAGEGILQVSLFGLIPLVNLRGTPAAAHGELMRFLAEAAWYPTALLPSQGVQWQAIDDSSAVATLVDGVTEVSLTFCFGEGGLIESVRAQARGRMIGDAIMPTAWEGRWHDYQIKEGMRIPLQGEVAWLLPEGRKPYWRGSIARVAYEFAP